MFDALEDNGDAFALVHGLEPDEQNLPLRLCMVEMAKEWCRFYENEAYCLLLKNECEDSLLLEPECRPKTCPLNKRGCKVVSTCLQKTVLAEYQQALGKNVVK